MAAWMVALSSSPPDGLTVFRTGTVGIATPPPMYPACEKSTIRSPAGVVL